MFYFVSIYMFLYLVMVNRSSIYALTHAYECAYMYIRMRIRIRLRIRTCIRICKCKGGDIAGTYMCCKKDSFAKSYVKHVQQFKYSQSVKITYFSMLGILRISNVEKV